MTDLPTHSLAAVFQQPGQPLEIREFPLPQLRQGEALVKVTCCTICGSDLHTIRGDRGVSGPTILGHEIIGKIADVAGDVCDIQGKPIKPGDRITWSVAASCGDCFYCKTGLPQKCTTLFKYGHEAINDAHPLSGGLAEYCHLARGTAIVKVPEPIPDQVACPANCATATVAAAMRVAGDCDKATIVVHGAGMLGLTTAAMAGGGVAIVSDIRASRLERATSFGSDFEFEPSDDQLDAHVTYVTDGLGADVVFEMSGANSAIEHSVGLLRIGGRLILVGSVFPSDPIRLPAEQIVRKLLRIEGVHNYTPNDLVTAIDFLSKDGQRFPFGQLIDSEYPLTEVNEAIERAMSDEVIRVAIRP